MQDRYLLFLFLSYDAVGGMGDLYDAYTSLEEAQKELATYLDDVIDGIGQIYDRQEDIIVATEWND